jgi:putative RecB family exonuclease
MPVYSHSRLRVYETCPRQYRFRYVERVKVPQVETVEMFLGSHVHGALEALYRGVRAGRAPTLDELLAGYRGGWQAEWADSIQISRPGLTAADYLAMGARHLSAFHARYQPFDQERTVAVERRILFPLDEPRKIWMQGFIDRLSVTREGLWQIRDYKTGQWLPTQQDVDADRQLALYQIGVQRHFPRHAREVELIWHYLAHDLELRSRREPATLGDLERRTLGLIDAIEADTTWAMVEGNHCHRCSYQSLCPAWAHLFRKEPAQLELTGPSEDGDVLVDRLAGLHSERRALDARIARTEADIVAYAVARGLTSVFGSTHRARISIRHTLAYPRKGDPARDALERLIKTGGRWEEVSQLSLQLVARKVAEGVWPADLAEHVRRFAQPGERARVALSRRPDSAE